jgi:hypothetical protein
MWNVAGLVAAREVYERLERGEKINPRRSMTNEQKKRPDSGSEIPSR